MMFHNRRSLIKLLVELGVDRGGQVGYSQASQVSLGRARPKNCSSTDILFEFYVIIGIWIPYI